MLLNLFNEMRAAKVPVSVRELLDLINALKQRVTFADMDEFYYLARAILVKDERHFDKVRPRLRRLLQRPGETRRPPPGADPGRLVTQGIRALADR